MLLFFKIDILHGISKTINKLLLSVILWVGLGRGHWRHFSIPLLNPKDLLFFPHCFPIIVILTIMGFTLLKLDCTDLVTNNNQHIFFVAGTQQLPLLFLLIFGCVIWCVVIVLFFSLSLLNSERVLNLNSFCWFRLSFYFWNGILWLKLKVFYFCRGKLQQSSIFQVEIPLVLFLTCVNTDHMVLW